MIEFSALQSRFGRRLLLLFVGLALIPICTLALITYLSVGGELRAVSEERLKALTKATTMSLLERLELIDEQLSVLASPSALASADPSHQVLEESSRPRFRRLTWVRGDGESIGHDLGTLPALSLEQRLHLAAGRMLLLVRDASTPPRLLAARQMEDAAGNLLGELWGEIEPSYLWWGIHGENHLPPATELCVVQPKSDRTLFCSSGEGAAIPVAVRRPILERSFGEMDWLRGGEPHRAHFRTLHLGDLYGHPSLTVIVSEALAKSSGPLREFRLSFLPVVLVTLWVVILLSIRQIRGRLAPLERLRAGTRDIARRHFDSRVEVSSGDEFEELADAFNRMARRLGRQFRSLTVLSDIQSAVLSVHEESDVAAAVLARLGRLLPCAGSQVVVLDERSPGFCKIYSLPASADDRAGEPRLQMEERLLSAEELWWLRDSGEIRVIDGSEALPAFLTGLRVPDAGSVLVLAIVIDSRVAGVLAAGLERTLEPSDETLAPIRQLGNQIALALSKSLLIGKLRALNVGTMSALARAIDANSRWTRGHSERVKELAVRLGRAMGLSSDDLDVLERGALLHDIGKVGIPPSILDKDSRLTPDEWHLVKQHPKIGVNILRPVPSLADTLPLVEQHHEWYDGNGYPYGLAGDEIHPLARLLAVVDCYDALRSARPYRDALEEGEVRRHLRGLAGKQFDPLMVDAFLEVLLERDREGREPDARAFRRGWGGR